MNRIPVALAVSFTTCALLVTASAASAKDRAGDPDPSFGIRGVATVPFAGQQDSPFFSGGIAETSKHQVVQGVFAVEGPGAVTRYTAKGYLDATFGDDGIAGLGLVPGEVNPRDLAVDAHDRIVVTGEGYATGDDHYGAAVARLLPDGRPDPAFSNDGFNLPEVLKGTTPREVVYGRKGRIVVTGSVGGFPNSTAFVARFLPDGNLDPAFSKDGYRLVRFSPTQGSNSVAIDGKNRIVIGASTQGKTYFGTYALVRIRPNGTLDNKFGNNGMAVATGARTEEGLKDITVARKGRILATGKASAGGSVVRFKSNGRMDRSFGWKGRKVLSWFEPASISTDLEGRPVLVGSEYEGRAEAVRLTRNGHDSKFSGYGIRLSGLDDHYIDSKNRVVAGGYGDGEVGVTRILNP